MVWTTPIGEGIRPGYQGSHTRKDTKDNAMYFVRGVILAVSRNATESMAIEVLADLLPRFVMEARRGRLVKEVCERAGFSGRYHSGKVTCATELFAHNVDDWTFPLAAYRRRSPKLSKQVVAWEVGERNV